MNSLPFACCIAAVLGLLLPVAMISAQKPNPYTNNITITSKSTTRDFVPDGDLSKRVWRSAVFMSLDEDAVTRKKHSGAQTRIAASWTAKYLYIAYRCEYSVLNLYEGEPADKEKWGLWDRDVVEAFINPAPERFNHYYEFEVAPNNLWIDLEIDLDKKPFNDAGWDSHFEHATRVDEANHIWTCEMKIPVRALTDQPLKVGAEWRINFYRAYGQGDDTKRHFISWGPLPGARFTFHQPASFGIIRFVK
ncbi:MAG TPA: carbohydrate-binding family 9-like protein [Acidobacteriota bacterium]|nr:carbohydrate-binding family 9-like protein [Acidobacteriota bacterium]